MAQSVREHAENASFQAFVNCYLREVDAGQWLPPEVLREVYPDSLPSFSGSHALKLRLPKLNTTLLFDISYRSLVGRHEIIGAFSAKSVQKQETFQRDSLWSVILLLVKELFQERSSLANAVNSSVNSSLNGSGNSSVASSGLKHRQLELTHRLTDSLQNMTHYLEWRSSHKYEVPLEFCAAEQSLIFGHWLHPTPKSRQGILEWQHELVTPELQGKFQLHYFAVHRELVDQQSILPELAEDLVRASALVDASVPLGSHEVLIPTHPLQAQWLLSRPMVQGWLANGSIRDLGVLGRHYSATSSVRTVYAPEASWMLKLSLPVKITNSLRQNKNHELHAGVLMAALLKRLNFSAECPQFRIISDPAYMTLKTEDGQESGFEVIIRENFIEPDAAQPVVCLAALLQDPWHPEQHASMLKTVLTERAVFENRAVTEVAEDWFNAYWYCAIEPCLRLFDKHGIALEAHQQNSLLCLEDGYPTRCLYRDNQGFYLAESSRNTLSRALPELRINQDLFYSEQMILDRFGYYLIVNQLFSVMHRLGVDQLLPEAYTVKLVQEKLEALRSSLTGPALSLVERLLLQDELPAKANLLTRVENIDELESELELASYAMVPNPLNTHTQTDQQAKELDYA